ncbi:MAG: cytochrome c biogenesis protein CcsA [Candidatus Neomarinimicrobiota bacterium]|nr:cytochrome C assembly protein [Candidatus Neomarinimicrobiota bacterium]MEC9475310.1 cytochrome c biogenesis protein CcsA [Candidatus Neomarinimicrobiota bacterium]|tara:strand:+ start:1394 stop:2065 length:672 start_codon:yes stop_codon:yes gene_type:complete
MELFYNNKKNLMLLIIASILFVVNLMNIIFFTPMIADQHWAQKIFYVHVPSAWVGFVGYLIVMISGFMLFIKNDNRWDDVALASAEIGTFFMALVLITGPVWAKPIWGTPWIWEPRLTTTLILFLYYMGYFMFRSFGGNIERVRRQAAALGIIAFINVPIIFLSVQFWEPEIQSHPQVEMASQPPEILYSFLFSLAIFSLLFAVMLQYRVHLIRTKNLLKSNV